MWYRTSEKLLKSSGSRLRVTSVTVAVVAVVVVVIVVVVVGGC